MKEGTLLAAVDLGSNSFRLEIGRLEGGHIRKAEYHKETVRQGNGLDADRNLTPEALERGWACLARFGERLAGFESTHVRAVATQTLREARNRDAFITQGSRLLGYPIDIVSGPEEARLIYQGVSHLLPQSNERRLVVDIGGRSTELILGQQYQSTEVASFRVGSVAWSSRYFPDGVFTPQAFEAAEIAAKAVLDEALDTFRPDTWDVAYGSSGTIGAVGEALRLAGRSIASNHGGDTITREGLDWLYERLLRAQTADRLRIEGVKEDRRAVIGGGVSVLRAVFELLQIEHMAVGQGALRHGALYDLLSRERIDTDLRATTVQALMQRFGVDMEQARRVSQTTCKLFSQSTGGANTGENQDALRKLHWAASLHEIGFCISHSSYHRHGAYMLDHTDAPGFSMAELHDLSLLVLGQRGKVRKVEAQLHEPLFALQLVCFRLAVILCHARRDPDIDGLQLSINPVGFILKTRQGWAVNYPQSTHLLNEEVMAWNKTAWSLAVDVAQ